LELINIKLYNALLNRIEPPKPTLHYVPLEKMYVNKIVFKKKYKLLQGDETDNEILSLLNLRTIVEESIKKREVLRGKFIDNKSEVD
jgi:hypothetical protein